MQKLTKGYPVINSKLTWRLLDGEAVIVSPTSGKIRVLNSVGTEIWQLLAEGSQVQEIESFLINNYQLSPQQAKADVSLFLEDLVKNDLITWETHMQ